MSDLLFSLPHYLTCDVLGNWVGMKGIIRLDSVYVSKNSRETFLATLKSTELVIADHDLYSDDFPDELVEWCLHRSIKFSVFAFGFQTCTAVSPAHMEKFFKLSGSTLKSFVMHSDTSLDDTPWLFGLAEDCSLLEVLEIEKDVVENENFSGLLTTILCKHAKTLQKFDISCGGLNIDLPVDSTFPVLEEFHVRAGNRVFELSGFLSTCPNLQRVTTSFALCDHDVSFLSTLASSCPHLNSINLLDMTNGLHIPEVIQFCPRGPALHLRFDPYMGADEEDIISVVTNLTNIQSLTFVGSDASDKVLSKIKTHCAKTLRKLSLQDCPTFKFKNLLALVKACKNLNILYLSNNDKLSPSQLCQLVRACPELTSLSVLYYPINDVVLETIGKYLTNLTLFNIEAENKTFCAYTLQGLYKVLAACPNLMTLSLGAVFDDLVTPTVSAQLKVLHPNVEIFGPELTAGYFMDDSDEIM